MKIVFYDGECGVCNGFVQFLLARDRGRFHYAPLQGRTAQARLGAKADLETMRFLDGERLYERSDAVLRIARELGGCYRLAGLLRILPRGMRDALYGAFARRRRQISPVAACRLATPEERRRFLE